MLGDGTPHASPTMRRPLVASLLLAALGCGGSSAAPASGEAKADEAKAGADAGVEAVTPPVPAVPAPPVVAATTAPPVTGDPCSAASFALPKGTVVATVDGEPVRVEELGEDAIDAEREALHTYCREVHGIREAAAKRAVEERLLANAARIEGVNTDAYVRGQLDARIERPGEAEVEAFYVANKTEQAPPFETVKGQVEEAMIKERSRKAFEDLIGGLRKSSTVVMSLPEVRPPPVDLAAAEHTATFGPKDAKVHIVEFSDFECPYCARAAAGVNAVKERFGDQVEFSFRHFPLSFHPAAQPAAEMAQCAQEQDKFWAMHDTIFGSESKLSPDGLRSLAEEAGLDMGELDTCLASGRARDQVQADMAKGREAGVRGTPSFYINGRAYEGGTSPAELTAAIEAELAGS